MFITNDFLILVFIKYITFIRGFIEPTRKLWLGKRREKKEQENLWVEWYLYSPSSQLFLEYTSTLQTTPIELNLIINVICFGCSQGWW